MNEFTIDEARKNKECQEAQDTPQAQARKWLTE
jgi:transmembrane sensor